ncbi:EamA family transporter [Aquirufa sp.]|uniref:EamA family transporter n=1 Tax=Aquirufa sp. TaxID=2676249 RepID=UPI0037BF0799
MQPNNTLSPKVLISLGLLYLIWGSTFLSVRILLEFLPPMVITFSRNLTAGVLLLAWSLSGGHWKKMTNQHWKVHLQAGFLLITLGNGFMALAGSIVPSGFSSVFMALGPMLLVVFFWISGRKPNARKILGTVGGLVGILLLMSQKSLAIAGKESEFFMGIGFLSVAVLGWNYGVFRIQFTQSNVYHFTQVCAIQMISGGLIVLVASTLHGDLSTFSVTELPIKAFGVFFYLALIGSMLGFSLFGFLSKACDATLVATYTYVNPLIALILGYIILQEPLHPILIFASFCILLAVVLITTDKSKP